MLTTSRLEIKPGSLLDIFTDSGFLIGLQVKSLTLVIGRETGERMLFDPAAETISVTHLQMIKLETTSAAISTSSQV